MCVHISVDIYRLPVGVGRLATNCDASIFEIDLIACIWNEVQIIGRKVIVQLPTGIVKNQISHICDVREFHGDANICN